MSGSVRIAQVTFQSHDMQKPETGTGLRWRYGWLVAFPDGTYEVVHDPYVREVVER